MSTRIISEAQRQRLEDLSEAGLLSGLSAGIAEKDIHVTDLLRNLASLKVEHSHFERTHTNRTGTYIDDGIKLIFAGGTCLAKAHGTIRRMSEDIDIKIVLGHTSVPLAKEIGTRARLKALHSAIEKMIGLLEFEVPAQVDGLNNPFIRDNSRYYIVETLAEKVLSLLRRCAWNWSGYQKNVLDPTLVRHVYDVHQIAKADPATVELAGSVFKALVETDIVEFNGQNPEFDQSPGAVLLATLESARTNEALTQQYTDRVLRLIYGRERPSYNEAFGTFELVARTLLEVL